MSYKELKDENEVSLGFLPESKEGGRLRNKVYMTSSGNYVKPAWLKFAIVKGVGGGGGGGGVAATSTAQKAVSGGAGAGGYFEKRINANNLSASETVTIGAGGNGGAAGANTGATGGTTSFGTHCSATGGTGGVGGSAIADTVWGAAGRGVGGAATGGDLNMLGDDGVGAIIYFGAALIFGVSGASKLSGKKSQSFQATGNNGDPYGGGGSGVYASASQPTFAGGAGSAGIVIIEEYE